VQTRHPAKKSGRDGGAPSALALRGAMSEAPDKDFLIFFFKISLSGAAQREHPTKSFFYFFRIFFAECRIGEAPSKDFSFLYI
jgi:hypothetical protein